MVEPINFINTLRESDTYIPYIYLHGGCYQFYKVLKLLYPRKAVAYKVKTTQLSDYDHILTKIDGKYYDITGEVQSDTYFGLERATRQEKEVFKTWSFAFNNWLYKECPNCGEPITG